MSTYRTTSVLGVLVTVLFVFVWFGEYMFNFSFLEAGKWMVEQGYGTDDRWLYNTKRSLQDLSILAMLASVILALVNLVYYIFTGYKNFHPAMQLLAGLFVPMSILGHFLIAGYVLGAVDSYKFALDPAVGWPVALFVYSLAFFSFVTMLHGWAKRSAS